MHVHLKWKIYKIIRTGIHQESIIMFIRNDQYLNELNWTIIINDIKLVETSIIKTPPHPPLPPFYVVHVEKI